MHPFAVHVGCSRELVCPVIDCHAAAAADILLTPPLPKKQEAQLSPRDRAMRRVN